MLAMCDACPPAEDLAALVCAGSTCDEIIGAGAGPARGGSCGASAASLGVLRARGIGAGDGVVACESVPEGAEGGSVDEPFRASSSAGRGLFALAGPRSSPSILPVAYTSASFVGVKLSVGNG